MQSLVKAWRRPRLCIHAWRRREGLTKATLVHAWRKLDRRLAKATHAHACSNVRCAGCWQNDCIEGEGYRNEWRRLDVASSRGDATARLPQVRLETRRMRALLLARSTRFSESFAADVEKQHMVHRLDMSTRSLKLADPGCIGPKHRKLDVATCVSGSQYGRSQNQV